MALGGNKSDKPGRLDAATQRFEAAMQRLEKVLKSQKAGVGGADLQKMTDETAILRQENEKLSNLNKVAGERLDGAIKHLKTVLRDA